MMKSQINTSGKICKVLAILLSFLLIFEQSGFAQIAGQLDISGHLAGLRNAFSPDVFRPLHLRYLSYNPQDNSFRLFLDKGNLKNPNPQELEDTTKILLNYFFIGITLPNDTFWVNLRPDAEDNIIDDRLAQTDVGKIMLETDLQLKKDTAQFTSPETPEGREYWDKLYKKAGEIFGSENITIPTLTRPWIVPDEIIIRETVDSAYIYKATLKVMLEQDYLKDSAVYSFKDDRLKELNEYSSQLIREIIIPKLTKEVNSSKRYASLRQVYYSLIMAQWFKARHYGKEGLYAHLIDRKDLTNLTSKEIWSKTTYFKEYQKSFKDGEYNIKEPTYTPFGQSIRTYVSGGVSLTGILLPQYTNITGKEVTRIQGGRNTELVLKANRNIITAVFNGENIDITPTSVFSEPTQTAILTFEKAGPGRERPVVSSPVKEEARQDITIVFTGLEDIVNKINKAIEEGLIEQIKTLGNMGNFRVVNTGSTGRGTSIFGLEDKGLDIDFMILFKNKEDLERFQKDYLSGLPTLEVACSKQDLTIKHEGAGLNLNGDPKISYFVSGIDNSGRNFNVKLEVSLSLEKTIYVDWFKKQLTQAETSGVDIDLLRQEIMRMKQFLSQLTMYKKYEGGMGAIGAEQLIMQSAGAEDGGRSIRGIGSFYKALDWICNKGLDEQDNVLPLGNIKNTFQVFDPETGLNLVNRLDDDSWFALANLAKEYRKRIPYELREFYSHAQSGLGREQAKAWSAEEVEKDSVEDYAKRTFLFGSGNYAVHLINPELVYDVLRSGYLMPRIYLQHFINLEDKAQQLANATRFIHFIVNGTMKDWKGNDQVAFFVAVEPLLENKSYGELPSSGQEWAVSGFSDSAYDTSSRFYINALGIIFVPKTFQNDGRFQELLSSLPYHPRIYYYEESNVQEAIAAFLNKYNIKPQGSFRVSGYIERSNEEKEDHNIYINIAPWAAAYKAYPSVDAPHTAEEYADIALRLYDLSSTMSWLRLPEGRQMAKKAYELDPNSAKANLLRALYYYDYGEDQNLDWLLRYNKRNAYFEKAIELGLPRKYLILALDRLIKLYPYIGEFGQLIAAQRKLLDILGPGDAEVERRRERIKSNLEGDIKNQIQLESFIKQLNRTNSLEELSNLQRLILSHAFPDIFWSWTDSSLYFERLAAIKIYSKLLDVAKLELERLYENSVARINELYQEIWENKDSGSKVYELHMRLLDEINSNFSSLENHLDTLINELKEKIGSIVIPQAEKEDMEVRSNALVETRKNFMSNISVIFKKADEKKECKMSFYWGLQEIRRNLNELQKAIGSGLNLRRIHYYCQTIDDELMRAEKTIQHLKALGIEISEFQVELRNLIKEAESQIDNFLGQTRKIDGLLLLGLQAFSLLRNYPFSDFYLYKEKWNVYQQQYNQTPKQISQIGKQEEAPQNTGLSTVSTHSASVPSSSVENRGEALEEKPTVSSPVEVKDETPSTKGGIDPSTALRVNSQDEGKGGIDFRALPIVTQNAISNLRLNMNNAPLSRFENINLIMERQDIERLISAGIKPSTERLKEYLQAACVKGGQEDIDKILLCISDILRQEEERCDHTNPILRDILVVLESMRNAQELRQVFLGKNI